MVCSACHGVCGSGACHPPRASPPNERPAIGRSTPPEGASRGDLKVDSVAEDGGDAKAELDTEGRWEARTGVELDGSAVCKPNPGIIDSLSVIEVIGRESESSSYGGRIVAVSEKVGMLSRNPGERSFASGSLSSSSSAVRAAESRGSDTEDSSTTALELDSTPLELELLRDSEDAKCSEVLPKVSEESVEAKGFAHGSGELERLRNGSANGLSSRACREEPRRSSKPSMDVFGNL